MRLAATLGLLLLGCSAPAEQVPRTEAAPAEAPPAEAASCPDVAFGGWDDDAGCAAAAAQLIAGADRACRVDADCVAFGPNCGSHAVVAAQVAHYQAWPSPCTDPAGGQCPPACGATCRDGCCEVLVDGACW